MECHNGLECNVTLCDNGMKCHEIVKIYWNVMKCDNGLECHGFVTIDWNVTNYDKDCNMEILQNCGNGL